MRLKVFVVKKLDDLTVFEDLWVYSWVVFVW